MTIRKEDEDMVERGKKALLLLTLTVGLTTASVTSLITPAEARWVKRCHKEQHHDHWVNRCHKVWVDDHHGHHDEHHDGHHDGH
jgi:hypothetical protein